jgi:anaerobic selenocysteine-containing dehydrogenase
MDSTPRTLYRACNLCEAICGLEFRVAGERILSIRGDDADPFSRGHVCPKAVALKDVHEDPARLRRPLQRVGNDWRELAWDEAIELAADRLATLQRSGGNEAVGFYAGNPTVHNFGTLLGVPQLARVLKTRNAFSATSVDQLPQQLTSLLMFGHQMLLPIPDIDRTQYFLVIGANPVASNGSMMTVPDVTRRLCAIGARGGRLVVIDPRRTETAQIAHEHHFIRPGSDAALLMALVNVVAAVPGKQPALAGRLKGLDAALAAIASVTPQRAASATGIDAATIRRLGAAFAAAPSAVCYGRVGTTLQPFGTLTQWLIYLLNIVSGALDRTGGALLTKPLIAMTGPGTRAGHHAAWRSRVSGLPETSGELPVAALAEEILTPGVGQIRGLITIGGNPVMSTADGCQLERALATLDFMVSIDIYLNETTRHAHLILPPCSSLNHDHYDLVFNALAVRNVARFNAGIWPRAADERYDWEIFAQLGAALARRLERSAPPALSPREALQRMLLARAGPGGPSFAQLEAAAHGVDFGPLAPSLADRIETADRLIDCAPAAILADLPRFEREVLGALPAHGLRLIGRRHVRSNNSWMHRSRRLTKGKPRHQLMMHPLDAASRT